MPSQTTFPNTVKPRHEVQVRNTKSTGMMNTIFWQPSDVLDVKNFGAIGDGVTDDTAAIQAALDEAATWNDDAPKDADHPTDLYGGSAMVRLVGVFLVSKTLNCSVNLDCSQATLITFSNLDPVLNIAPVGGSGAGVILSRRYLYLPQIINKNPSTPATAIGTAVKITNLQVSKVFMQRIEAFQYGFKLIGDGDGCAWNNINATYVLNCQIGYLLDVQNGGYCNENQFYGCVVGMSAGSAVPGTRYIQLGHSGGGNYSMNNNTFYSPALEGDGPEFHIWCGARFCAFHNIRAENSFSNFRINFDNSSGTDNVGGCNNMFYVTYPANSIFPVFTYTGANAIDPGINTVFANAPSTSALHPGMTYLGNHVFDRQNDGSGRGGLVIDGKNHLVGVGRPSLASVNPDLFTIGTLNGKGVNLTFDDWGYVGETYSQQGLILGYNAKADNANTVADQVVAGNTYSQGYSFIRQSTAEQGIGFYVRAGSSVTQGDVLPKVSSELIFKIKATGPVINTLPGFTAGAKYLIIDGSGNVRVSGLGPAS